MKKILIPLFASFILLGGCNNGVSNETNTQNQSTLVPVDTSVSSSTYVEPAFTPISTDPISTGSVGGSLIEVSVGKYLEQNSAYTCTFTPSSYADTTIVITTSHSNVATIEFLNGSKNTFQILTHEIGDSLIRIYANGDAKTGDLVYRDVVHVRRTYSEKEIQNKVFEVDTWASSRLLGNYKMLFLTMNPLSGTISGSDDMEKTNIDFTLDYVNREKVYDFNFYKYSIDVSVENKQTNRTFTFMYVAVTGDEILVYYGEGLFEMFHAE